MLELVLPAAFDAVIVYVFARLVASGRPEISPVAASMARPAGRAGATVHLVTCPVTVGRLAGASTSGSRRAEETEYERFVGGSRGGEPPPPPPPPPHAESPTMDKPRKGLTRTM